MNGNFVVPGGWNVIEILAATFLIGYLIGGVPFGYLVARWRGVDILSQGSGNIGATNVGRVLGRRLGIVVFCLDFAKGAVPVAIALRLAPVLGVTPVVLAVTAGLAAFLGHVFPIYLRFRGGKGVATGAGVVSVLLPTATLAALVVWLVVVCATGYVSVASITAALTLCIVHLVATPTPLAQDNLVLTIFCLVAAGLVLVRHRANLGRLRRGEENRLTPTKAMQQLPRTVHVLAVGLWFGMAIFFSFAAAPALFQTLEEVAARPRAERPLWLPLPAEFDQSLETRKEQGTRAAGVAISPLFGWYFPIQLACAVLAAATAVGWAVSAKTRLHRWRAGLALTALFTVVVGWPLEREVSALRVARNEARDAQLTLVAAMPLNTAAVPGGLEEAKQKADAARTTFVRWHLASLLLNFVTCLLVTGTMVLAAHLPDRIKNAKDTEDVENKKAVGTEPVS
jgi:acyl-phosphate glycerol 3-phosphate acyltransferase